MIFCRTLVCVATFLLAQEAEVPATGTAPANADVPEVAVSADNEIAVKKGKAIVEGVAYPVFKGIKTVDKSSFQGIRYEVPAKDNAAAMAEAQKIKAFYTGKIIGGAKIGKFKKFGSPERKIWYAVGKSKGKQRLVGIFVHDGGVTVHVMPDGDSDSMVTLL